MLNAIKTYPPHGWITLIIPMKLSEFQKWNEFISNLWMQTQKLMKKKYTSAVVLSLFWTVSLFWIEQSANDFFLHTLQKKQENSERYPFIQLTKASQNRKSYLFSHDSWSLRDFFRRFMQKNESKFVLRLIWPDKYVMEFAQSAWMQNKDGKRERDRSLIARNAYNNL